MSIELWTKVDDYIDKVMVESDDALKKAVSDSKKAGLPDIQVTPSQGKFLHIMARLIGAKNILEVGTLGGYSSIWMARALQKGGKLITLELAELHAKVALANFKRAGLDKIIELRQGPAIESLAKLEAEHKTKKIPSFDLVFIDADKQNNSGYLEYALKMTRKGGLIIVDNVIRDGKVIEAKTDDEMVKGVQKMNKMIAKEPRLVGTSVQTVGAKGYDGFSIMLVD